ncbi:UNVERIFIED_CONTAM: catF [Trichonephila clavipes]
MLSRYTLTERLVNWETHQPHPIHARGNRPMTEAFICDAVRTPIGRYGGALASVRADDLAALPLKALMERNPGVDWSAVDDLIYGCANQAGEDNRNVGRMAVLLAGMPIGVPGTTVNRLCGSGMDAVGMAARAIKAGDCDFVLAGGVESMSRAPFVMPKAESAFSRANAVYDTTIGWRFVNPLMKKLFGVDSMPQTADNVAADFAISRADQDAFAARSQARWAAAQEAGIFADEIVPVTIPQRKGDPIIVAVDEHPRPGTTAESLAKLKGVNGPDLSVTAGNASGVNDGAAALAILSEQAARAQGLTPKARIVAMAAAGVEPRIMGIGPAPAAKKVLARAGLTIDQMDVIELNEAFASQALATLRDLGLPDDAAQVNPNGGAIALGHPLGMSGARLVTTAMYQLHRTGGRYALCTMCIGVGQGIAIIIERV